MTPSIVALIPARMNSRRVPNKNIRDLGGKPLIVWTINAAKESGIFDRIIVASDDLEVQGIAAVCEVEYFKREPVTDNQPDIEWVRQVFGWLDDLKVRPDAFAILRPTSPFRTAHTIQRAWQHFIKHQPCDSLRAVEPVKQHPYKMWRVKSKRIVPLFEGYSAAAAPFHSSPTQTLESVFIQNASLEIAWTSIAEAASISGGNIVPFFTEGYEGYDINTEEDFERAERIAGLHERELLNCL